MSLPSSSVSRFSAAALALVLVAAGGVARADDMGMGPGGGAPQRLRDDRDDAGRAERRHHENRGLGDAVRRVERATGGEVLSAESVPFDGRSVSRIKVVDASGRVRVYMDDPQNAALRRTRGDDDKND